MRMSSVCFVLFLGWLTCKPVRDWLVTTSIQSSSTACVTTWVSSVIWIELVPSGLLKMLLNTFVFFVMKSGPQRLIVNARAHNRHFLRPTAEPLLTGDGHCHVEFQATLEDAQNWFVGSTDIKNTFHQMRIPDWLQAFLAHPAVFASEVRCSGKTIKRKRVVPDSWTNPVPTRLPVGSLGRCFSYKMSRITARSRAVLTLLFSSVVTTPLHRCKAANMAWDPKASVGGMLTMLGFWLAAQTALTFILHVSMQVYGEPASMFTKYSLPAVVPTFSVMKCLRPTHTAVGRENGYHVCAQSSHGRSLCGARQWSRVLRGASHSWGSLNP